MLIDLNALKLMLSILNTTVASFIIKVISLTVLIQGIVGAEGPTGKDGLVGKRVRLNTYCAFVGGNFFNSHKYMKME